MATPTIADNPAANPRPTTASGATTRHLRVPRFPNAPPLAQAVQPVNNSVNHRRRKPAAVTPPGANVNAGKNLYLRAIAAPVDKLLAD